MQKLHVFLAASLLALAGTTQAGDTTAQQQLSRFQSQAAATGNAAAGQQFFTQKHGGEWSCASCHNTNASAPGKHASTGKFIKPLSPFANADRFTDMAKVDKWFKRNCNDVLKRECTAAEKANIMAWILTQR